MFVKQQQKASQLGGNSYGEKNMKTAIAASLLCLCVLLATGGPVCAEGGSGFGGPRDNGDWRWGLVGPLMDKGAWDTLVNRPRSFMGPHPGLTPLRAVAPRPKAVAVPKAPEPDPCAKQKEEEKKAAAATAPNSQDMAAAGKSPAVQVPAPKSAQPEAMPGDVLPPSAIK